MSKDPSTDSFEKRVGFMEKLGIEHTQESEWRGKYPDRQEVPLELFGQIRLPLNPEEWCNVCMSDGPDYVGGCCAQSSAIQDNLNHWFRSHSGWAPANELMDMAEMWESHGDEEWTNWDAFAGKLGFPNWDMRTLVAKLDVTAGLPEMDPWEKICLCAHIVRGYQKDHAPAKSSGMSEWDKAARILSRSLTALDWMRLFEKDAGVKRMGQSEAERMLVFAKIYPALGTLWKGIESTAPPPFEGYAIVHRDSNEAAVNRLGPCVFADYGKAEEMLALWQRSSDQYEDGDVKVSVEDNFDIKPVRITLADGMVFE